MEASLRKSKLQRCDMVFIVLFVFALLFTLWKLPFGFGWYDESFYVTIPHRMLSGDAFIADEWHPGQLFGFLTLPFVAAYRAIHGNIDGILLFMRVIYVVFHFLVGLFLYKRLSKDYGIIASFCAFSFLVFTPFDIMAPSYNSIGMDAMIFTGVGLSTEDSHSNGYFNILYGVTYAASVLCCPYLASLLPCYFILFLIEKHKQDSLVPGRNFLLFLIGIMILFFAFVAFECSHSSVGEVLRNFPELFMDAEHTGESVFDKLRAYFNHAPHHFNVALILFGIILFGIIIDSQRKRHKAIWLILSCIPALWGYAWSYANLNEYYNALMMPLFFPGLISYLLLDRKPKRIFVFLMVSGLIYSLCMCFSSNVGFHAVSIAYSGVNVASWCFIGKNLYLLLKNGNQPEWKINKYVRYGATAGLLAVLCCLLFLQLKTKATHVFYDGSPSELTETIAEGPAKGIKTAPAKAGEYQRIGKDIRSFVEAHKNGPFLVLSEKTWCYLFADSLPYATYSAWLSGVNETTINRLRTYYENHSEKLPLMIYIEKPFFLSEGDVVTFAEVNGYNIEADKLSYKMYKE